MKYFSLVLLSAFMIAPAFAAEMTMIPPVPTAKPPQIMLVSRMAGTQPESEPETEKERATEESAPESTESPDNPEADKKTESGERDAETQAPEEQEAAEGKEGAEDQKTASAELSETEAAVAPEEPAKRVPYTKPYVGETIIYTAKYEDTFIDLARKHDLGFVELRAANPYLDPWMPGEGQEVLLPSRHLLPDVEKEGIVINLPEMRLYAFLDSYAPPVTHPLGIGRDGLLTPIGQTKIVRKKEAPTWRPTQRMKDEDPDLPDVVEPGPMNPLGSHALYLGWPTYAIHGTNRPYGIGRRVSSGCIRLYPEDIESFFKKIPVGTKVTVTDQPIKAAWIDDDFYVEAHLTMEQADVMEDAGGIPSYEVRRDDMKLILDKAGKYADALDWHMIRRVIRERSGYPVRVFTKPEMPAETSGTDGEDEKENAGKS